MNAQILIIEDDKATREGLAQFLEKRGYETSAAADRDTALAQARAERPDLALMDLRIPGVDGLHLLHEFLKNFPETPVIMLTAYGTVENAVQAMKAGAYYYLTKPLNLDEIELVVKKALRERTLVAENQALRDDLAALEGRQEIIGAAPVWKKFLRWTERVSRSDAPVVIQGESGSGKELVARFVHDHSGRVRGPFVTLHCAAITESLLTSELFGHERGAFTDAKERKLGRFERAHQGSLFLDEVAEIPESMQVKLLRVLQNGEFERVGGSKTLRADARIISATNKDLAKEVREGRFREDLYYRLNVILLEVPPLRERVKDIPLLVEHFIKRFAPRNQSPVEGIEPDALDALLRYAWPGNVRELANITERMVILGEGPQLTLAHVPPDIRLGAGLAREPLLAAGTGKLEEVERELILKKLHTVSGNKSRAAKELGISRKTLYRKLAEIHQGRGDSKVGH